MPRKRGVTRAQPVTYCQCKAADLTNDRMFDVRIMLPGTYKTNEQRLKKCKELNRDPQHVDIIRVMSYEVKKERFWMSEEFYILHAKIIND